MEKHDMLLMRHVGIKVRRPMMPIIIHPDMLDIESTWAEKKRDKLIRKMRIIKAIVNLLLFIPIWIAMFLLIVFSFGWVSLQLHNRALEPILGVIIGLSIIISTLLLSGILPTNPRNVRVKHRGKYIYS